MTPQHLHAVANLWSLSGVWPNLLRASEETQESPGGDLGTVQAWRPGSGVHGGGTNDQILEAVLRNGVGRDNPYAPRVEKTRSTITWLAEHLDLPVVATAPVDEYLAQFRTAVPQLRPATALELAMWIGEQDRAVRKLLERGDDHDLIPATRCPRCDTAGSLAIRTSNPDPHLRPIICTQRACHMPGGIPSIWTRHQLMEALACSSTTTAPDGAPQPNSPSTSEEASPSQPSATGPAETGSPAPA